MNAGFINYTIDYTIDCRTNSISKEKMVIIK